MGMKKLKISLYRIFRKMGVPRELIHVKHNLNKDFGFDSLDMQLFLFFIESRFDINIKDNEIDRFSTVESTMNYLMVRTNISQ